MVVGTLNLGSEMGLQFQVPTTMRGMRWGRPRHGARQGWDKVLAACLALCVAPLPHMVVVTLHCSILVAFCPISPPVSIPFSLPVSLPVWAPVTPCLLMVVGTLNCSPVSLPRFRVPTTILSHPLSCSLSRPLSHSLSRHLSCSLSGSPSPHASSWWWGP